ncbi:methyl-accepting chemotaxis protein [Methylomonas sp. MED-D]|uniref:methyl-accepting chemotaxis protein n=1 Tax=unclassified Methylomonas TaxID=2608980 RepID=UPI0028A4DDE6|nr:PAS domain-containing methyl-accepting chemotaxis protein [Methylomonas sp. MV1]MDT4331460.1 PAS domain-containing methyl-accepting chemotaxis protein [Methylomonas sp. MV1]
MKKNLPITQREIEYSTQLTITSATDTAGRIGYINHDFIKISGFSGSELLGESHNIVRHPDMPPAAFADLWQTIKSGKPWMGIVKNRCKNGDHYWVDAFVTPRFDQGKIIGYESVRVKPDPSTVARAREIYEKMNAGKTGSAGLGRLTLTAKLTMSYGLPQTALAGILYLNGLVSPGVAAGLAASALAVGYAAAALLLQPLSAAAAEARKVIDNPLTQRIYTADDGEIGQLLLAIKLLKAKSRTIIRRLIQATEPLAGKADSTHRAVRQVSTAMDQQLREIEQIASAIHQMSATVSEVARSAANAADAANNVSQKSQASVARVNDTIGMMESLAGAVNQAEAVIQVLSTHSQNIGGVLDVIQGIAEQTNLLALNAAIEAARAGDQGRGFAVVADEVRTLAGRTQKSTEQIHRMINDLRGGTENAVAEMARVREMAAAGSEHGKNSTSLLHETLQSVGYINEMIVQIASAAEQQHVVSEGIARTVEAIGNLSRQTSEHATQASEAAGSVSESSRELDLMVEQFDDQQH